MLMTGANILELAQCSDWTPWGDALGISVKGGKYVVEYGFFVFLSVSCYHDLNAERP
jgi:hypothetical protein